MKKSILAISIFLTLLTPASIFALSHEEAQERVQDRRAELQAQLEERRLLREQTLEELRGRIRERRATREAQLAEHRKERIRAFWQRLNARILAAIARLEKLIARIESRIAKIEEGDEDIDTAPIKEQLTLAKEILVDARAEKEAADIVMEEVLSSEDPRGTFSIIRDEVHKIKRKLIEAHRILVHVIGDIMGLRVGTTRTGAPTVIPTVEPTEEPTP